jgi:hypothetical protein
MNPVVEVPPALVVRRIEEIAAAVPAHQRVTFRRPGSLPYLTRYHLGDFADGGHLYLHNIHRPDEDAELHSHPWGACALVLVGGYSELRRVRVGSVDGVVERVLRRGDLNVIELDTFHRIASVEPHTWTLLATTPKAQSWSFWNSVTGETLHHAAFLAGKRGPATRRP